MSNPQHYSGPELGALLAQVRDELGQDATIHEANKVRTGGIGGFFTKESFEITASSDDVTVVLESDEIVTDTPANHDATMSPNGSLAMETAVPNTSHTSHASQGSVAVASEPAEVLEPLDVIGDLSLDDLVMRDLSLQASQSALRGSVPIPSRHTERPDLSFNFDKLGPIGIPSRLESTPAASPRTPVPTPGPMRTKLGGQPDKRSASVGEVVADALMERAELVNALEHLDTADQFIASEHEQAAPNHAGPTDSSFASVLNTSLDDPYLDEAYEPEDSGPEALTAPTEPRRAPKRSRSSENSLNAVTAQADETDDESGSMTTSEAVAQRIAAQDVAAAAGSDDDGSDDDGAAVSDSPVSESAAVDNGIPSRLRRCDDVVSLAVDALDSLAAKELTSAPELMTETVVEPTPIHTLPTAPEPNPMPEPLQPAATDRPDLARAAINIELDLDRLSGEGHDNDTRTEAPREPGGNRARPDFWSRMALAREEVALYQLPESKVTAIIGPLDLALPIARRCQQNEWIGIENLAVLSPRSSIAGVPSWQTVSRVDDLHWAMNEWRATQRRGIVVVDTKEIDADQLLVLIGQLRKNGADMVRIALPPDLEISAFTKMSREIGEPIAVDLPAGTSPEAVLNALDQGLRLGSIGGFSLTAELLVALRSELNGD